MRSAQYWISGCAARSHVLTPHAARHVKAAMRGTEEPAYLRGAERQGDEGGRKLAAEGLDDVLVPDEIHVDHEDLHRGEHDRRVRVLQARAHALHDVLRLARVDLPGPETAEKCR